MSNAKKYHYFVIILAYTIAVTYITYPLLFNLNTLITGFGDELLIAWIHNWVVHALFKDPLNIFNANIYYPFKNSLAYSDFFIVTSILGYIPYSIFREPVVFINFTIISSLIFLGFSVYCLSYYVVKNKIASFLSGFLIIFSPAVLDKFVHIQILAIAFVPLSILFFLKFLETKRRRFLIISMICFVLQTINSFMPGYFIAFSLVIILITFRLQNRKKLKIFLTKSNLLIVFLSILLIIPVAIPYFSVSKEFNYVRDIRDTIHLALQPEDYFNTNHYSRLEPFLSLIQSKTPQNATEYKSGFIGFVFTLLAVIAIVIFIRKYKKKSWQINSLFWISLFGFIMSLGPFLHLFRQTIHHPFPIPLPYALFYYIIPGFQGIRNSSRWEMLFIVSITVVIAFVLHQLMKKMSFKKQIVIYIFLIVGIVSEFNFPLHYYQVPQKSDFPKIYSWIATTPKDSVIIEMPIFTWDMQPYVFQENYREYYSTVHFRKMVNGASGFSPPPWQDMAKNLLFDFPNENTVSKLSDLNVNYIIIHTSEYDLLHKDKFTYNGKTVGTGDDIIQQLNKNKSLKFIKKIEDDYVYELRK